MEEHRYAEVNGVRLHYVTVGQGPLILFVHGFPEFWYAWRAQLAHFARDHQAVAFDMRGHNLSSKPADVADYAMNHLVSDLAGLADHLGHRRFVLVGHDWGGAVAWHLAARHPERAATLTAVSTPHPRALAAALRSSAQPLRSAYIAFFRTPRLPELALGARGLAGLRVLLARSGLGPQWIQAYAGALAGPGALAAALAWYRAAGPSSLRTPAVTVPTCHLWGSADPALGRRATEATARWVTGPYHLQVLAGAGHWLPEQHAAELAGLVLGHLRQWPIGRAGG
jgi:epoxide hydrolase 4